MTPESAIVLFAHGARDVRWAQPLDRLRAAMVRSRPGMRIATAFLELQEPGLPEALAALAAEGVARIDIAPIFWSKGAHIARDLPALVAAFHEHHPSVAVRILPVLAELPGMEYFVTEALLAKVEEPRGAGGTP